MSEFRLSIFPWVIEVERPSKQFSNLLFFVMEYYVLNRTHKKKLSENRFHSMNSFVLVFQQKRKKDGSKGATIYENSSRYHFVIKLKYLKTLKDY